MDPVGLLGIQAFLLFFVSCRQYSSLHDLPWILKGRFKLLLIKEGAAKKPPEGRLMGPKMSIRRPPEMRLQEYRPWTHANRISNLTLDLLLKNYSEVLCSPGLGHIVIKGRFCFVPLCYSFLLHSKSWLQDSIQHQCRGQAFSIKRPK